MHVSSQQRFSKTLMRRKMIDGILDSFTWLLPLLSHTCQCSERRGCKNKMEIKLRLSHDSTHWPLHSSKLAACSMQLCDHGDQHWMMISSSGMLLEVFLPIASNPPTKTVLVMGCKGPIFHLCHKRVFQHRTSWSITVSLQEHHHLVLGEMSHLQKNIVQIITTLKPQSQSTHLLTTPKKLQMQHNKWHLVINWREWVEDGSDLPFQV